MGGLTSVEQIEENVGPDLIHGSGIVCDLGCLGEPIDATHGGIGARGREIQSKEIGGARIGRFGCHPSLRETLLVAVTGGVRIDSDDQSLDAGPELSGGLAVCSLQGCVRHFPRRGPIQVTGLVDDHPGLGQIDPSLMQSNPNPGVILDQNLCERELKLGGPSGPGEGSTDLGGGKIVDLDQIVAGSGHLGFGIGHRGHRGVELGLSMSNLPAPGLHEDHPIMSGQPVPGDRSQERS